MSENFTGALSRRQLLTIISAGCAVSISGCGGGSDGSAPSNSNGTGAGSSNGSGTGGGNNATFADSAIPAVEVTTSPGPAVDSPLYDRGIATTGFVNASTGGSLALPDGASLIIPPGALAADTQIMVTIPTAFPTAGQVPTADKPVLLKYMLSPAGTTFSKPVTLRRRIPDLTEATHFTAYTSSGLNPLINKESEQTNWQQSLVPASFPAFADIKLDHFTFIFAMFATTNLAYLVLDIPPEYLEVGDLLFTISGEDGPYRWRPGHVAAFVGKAPPFDQPASQIQADTIVEASGDKVDKNYLNTVLLPGGQNLRFGHVHIYLGARRALNSAGDGLTDAQKNIVASFLYQQLGKKYSVIGDTRVSEVLGYSKNPLISNSGFAGADAYSCVSLVEAALRAAGRSLLELFQRDTFSTPYEEYKASSPIPYITVKAGTPLEMPVYAVQLSPDSVYGLAWVNGEYSRNRPYTVLAFSLPPGANFGSTFLPDTTNVDKAGYKLTWTPQSSDIGKSYKTRFQFTGDPLFLGLGTSFNEYLEFRVVGAGGRYDPTLIPVDSQYVSVKSINRNGSILYIAVNYETGTMGVHIFKYGLDRQVLSFPLDSNSTLDVTNINDDEHFAYAVTSNGRSQAFLYKSGVSFDLGLDPNLAAKPLAINNNDEVVVGTTSFRSFSIPKYRILVSRDTVNGRKVSPITADFPEVFGIWRCIINRSGQIVLDASTGDPDLHVNEVAWIWLITNGQAEVIYTNQGIYVIGDQVNKHLVDFNDAGVMLVSAEDDRVVPPMQAIQEALTWKEGVFKQIATYTYTTQFATYTASSGEAITDAGQVIGGAVYNADNTSVQFLEDLIDYTSDVPKGYSLPILSGRTQIDFLCANKIGQMVVAITILANGGPATKKILALLTPT